MYFCKINSDSREEKGTKLEHDLLNVVLLANMYMIKNLKYYLIHRNGRELHTLQTYSSNRLNHGLIGVTIFLIMNGITP